MVSLFKILGEFLPEPIFLASLTVFDNLGEVFGRSIAIDLKSTMFQFSIDFGILVIIFDRFTNFSCFCLNKIDNIFRYYYY